MTSTKRLTYGALAVRSLIGALVLAGLISAGLGVARAGEIIPSVGITKATDQNAGDAKGIAGLALRGSALPFIKVEGAIGYRTESYSVPDVEVRMWPVTASAWLTPIPTLYAGGGIGWYRTTFDYPSTSPFEDRTTQRTGVHLGGGLDVPIAPKLGLDMHGRYIFMQDENDIHFPTEFNPDFWTTSIGLAFKF